MTFSQRMACSMKIIDPNLTGASATGAARAREPQRPDLAGSGAAGSSGSSQSGDRGEFSGALGRLSQSLSTYGSERAGKVQALATQYQSGSYRPDSAATSRGVVSEALAASCK